MLKELLKGRGAFLELIAAALILALGVNILSTAAVSALSLPILSQLAVSISLIFLSLLVMARRTIKGNRVAKAFLGAIVFAKEENELVRISRYKLSESISDYLSALFTENEAMKKVWSMDPLSNQLDIDHETKKAKRKTTESANLLRESIEYFALDRLSTHLTDYFNKPPFDRARLREFGREDVPSVLFKNRFLDTFSRPMTERPAFVDMALGKIPGGGQIIASFGPNRARYERFDLVLPKGSTVTRTSEGSVQVDTPKFLLSITAVFDGFAAVLPRRFEQLYLRREDLTSTSTYRVQVNFDVTFKTFSALTRSGWEYHMWLDSFLDSFESEFSLEEFLRRISWESSHTVFELMEGSRKMGLVKHVDERPLAQK